MCRSHTADSRMPRAAAWRRAAAAAAKLGQRLQPWHRAHAMEPAGRHVMGWSQQVVPHGDPAREGTVFDLR